MSTSFQCEKCSKPLPVAESFAGRVITCPYCRQTTTLTLHSSKAPDAQDPKSQEDAVATEPTMTMTMAFSEPGQSQNANDDADFDLSFEGDRESTNQEFDTQPVETNQDESKADLAPQQILFPCDIDIENDAPLSIPAQRLLEQMLETRAAMRERSPNFEPNPFACYFPLELTVTEEDRAEEEELASRHDDYDVNDLIEGIDKPDGGF